MLPLARSDHRHDLDIEAALDFLNTAELEDGVAVDHLHGPEDAAAWFLDHGVIHPGAGDRWRGADLERIRATRDALRAVVDAVVGGRAPDPGSVRLVDAALARPGSLGLALRDGMLEVAHRHADGALDEALAAVARPIVDELASGRPDRFRTCANDRCRWAFFDASPTGRRRWCDMRTCGNRAKARRHRERAKAVVGAGPGSAEG